MMWIKEGHPLWEDSLFISVENGFYSTEVRNRSFECARFRSAGCTGGLYLEMSVNNTVMEPRSTLSSVPYARVSHVAESVEGGSVNASQDIDK